MQNLIQNQHCVKFPFMVCVVISCFTLLVVLFGSFNCSITRCIKLQIEIANGGASQS